MSVALALVALVALVALAGVWAPVAASADAWTKTYKVVCAPELSHFALRTLGSDNVEEFWDGKEEPDLRASGIYPAAALSKAGVECRLPGHVLEAGGTYKPPNPRGACGLNEDTSLWLKVDGREVYRTEHLYGGCEEGGPWEVEVGADRFGVWVCRKDRIVVGLSGWDDQPRASGELCQRLAVFEPE